MSRLSGYDSEAVGFDSITRNKQSDTDSSTQTTEFFEAGMGTQTTTTRDCGSSTNADDFTQTENVHPPGLNEFLNRVGPAMLKQLELNQQEIISDSSEEDEEEIVSAKIFQEINLLSEFSSIETKASGDCVSCAILSVSVNSTGNYIAVAIGRTYHSEWCQHEGKIKIFNIKHGGGNKFVHMHDVNETSCVSVLIFHPHDSTVLAYGTLSGHVGIYNLRNVNFDGAIQLKATTDSHGSKMVTFLYWPDSELSNAFSTLMTPGSKVLITSGSDGKVNVWQVNVNLNVIEVIISYQLNGRNKQPAEDITCFDFLRNLKEDVGDKIFVVGTRSGKILACKTKSGQKLLDSEAVDPVYSIFKGLSTCILSIKGLAERRGVFASLSTNSELSLYDITQKTALKIIEIENSLSMMCLKSPYLVFGLANIDKKADMVKFFNINSEKISAVDGLTNDDKMDGVTVTAMTLDSSSTCRIVVGGNTGFLRIWDMPKKMFYGL